MQCDYTDALEAQWIIFPLHPIIQTPDGVKCGCERENCTNAGKHPKQSNWQHTTAYDAAQLEYLEDEEGIFLGNQLLDSHGVLIPASGLFVIDVDGRNGGFESAKKLQKYRDQCEYIIESGSGYGEHWYFKMPESYKDKHLATTLKEYPGIDFKSSGFVVGAYSLHASGHRYNTIKGSPQAVTEISPDLLDQLDRPITKTFTIDDTVLPVGELEPIVMSIKNSDHNYDKWLQIGMAIHHITEGSEAGKQLWIKHTLSTGRNDTEPIDYKWHTFGKSPTPVKAGTLLTWAQADGYVPEVTFSDNTDWGDISNITAPAKIKPAVDLLSPPGLVGEITKWINKRCVFPREHLAVAAALQIVSNAAGLNYLVEGMDTSLNLIILGIAGSRTGKGAIKKCITEVHRDLGLAPAEHGKFKSSQELVRNGLHHQIIIYVYDEFGKQLEKLANSSKGGTHYLEDLLAELIAIYSEATGSHGVSGDVKRELMELADREIARALKKEGITDDEDYSAFIKDNPESALAQAVDMRDRAEQGLIEPYLTFFGLSEPASFYAAIEKDPWLINGGFMGRALVFEELETVPKAKPLDQVTRDPLPESIMYQLRALLNCGGAGIKRHARIKRAIPKHRRIKYSPDGASMLSQVRQYWRDVAVSERDAGTGMESHALGATELVIKVAGILGVATETITREHVQWAFELIKVITLDKIERAKNDERLNSKNNETKSTALVESILTLLAKEPDLTAGVIRNRINRKIEPEVYKQALDWLTDNGKISSKENVGKNGKSYIRYFTKI